MHPGSLPSTLAGLFAGPARQLSGVKPSAEIAPGIRIGIDDSAQLDVKIDAKKLGSESSGVYPNSIDLAFTGPATWLALETEMDWTDLVSGRRYQLGICAVPDRAIECQAVVRLLRDDGSHHDHLLAKWTLSPTDRFRYLTGELELGAPAGVNMQQKPTLVIFFDTGDDFGICLNQLIASFS